MSVITLYDAEDPTSAGSVNINADIIALAGGGHVATWLSDTGDGDGQCIVVRFFAADGTPTGPEFVVNTTVTGNQISPEITQLADGRFIIVWASADTGDGSSGCIRARIMNANGTWAGSDFIVNTTASGSQGAPEVAALGNGGFMITWTSADTGDGSSGCVRGRVYDATGAAVADDFIVNTYTSGSQSSPEMLELANGGVLAAWSSGQFRFFESDGDPVAAGQLFAPTSGSNRVKSMTELTDGRIAIAFESSTDNTVHVQVINADGSLSGSAITVPTAAVGAHFANSPQIISLANGGFVVFWDQGAASTSIQDYKMRVYNADGSPASDEIVVAHVDTPGIGFSTATLLDNGNILVGYNVGNTGFVTREIAISTGLTATAFDDVVEGGAGADTISGLDGDDTLIGGEGDDTLTGGAGHDVFRFDIGDGHDTIQDLTLGGTEDSIFVTGFTHYTEVQEGADLRIVFDANNSILIKNATAATFTAADINIALEGELFPISGGPGADSLSGTSVGDHIQGLGGDDTVYADNGGDLVEGGDGNDRLFGEDGDDILQGGDGDDVIGGGYGNDIIVGGAGDDNVGGSYGDDIIYAGAGGYDVVSGGDGVDTINFAYATGAVYVSLYSEEATFGAEYTWVRSMENVVGSDFADTIIGNGYYNVLIGGDGDDILDGGPYSDEGDRMVGGAGDDTFRFSGELGSIYGGVLVIDDFTAGGTEDQIEVDGFTHFTKVQEGADLRIVFDAHHSILLRNVLAADFTADDINATEGGANVIDGTEASETIDGTANPDVVNALGGDDVVNGLDGTDTLNGGDGADQLNGGADEDTLNGDAGDDVLAGGDDDDILNGGIGNDLLAGGDGDDEINGGDGNDTAEGGAGNDNIEGGAGDDVLIGGAGDDLLLGGNGADTFRFEAGLFGADTVTDFANGVDLIQLTGIAGVDDFSDLAVTANGGNALITLPDGSTITLNGVSDGLVDASDFVFGG